MRRLLWKPVLVILFALLLMPASASPAQAEGEINVNIVPDKAEYRLGETMVMRLEVSGGVPPYTIDPGHWNIYEQDNKAYQREGTYSDGVWTLKADFGVSAMIVATISDGTGNGWVVWSDATQITGSEFHPLVCQLALDKATVKAGEPIACDYSISDGVAPFTFAWKWLIQEANGRWEGFEGTTQTADLAGEISLSPAIGESGYFHLTVTDAIGHQAEYHPQDPFLITGAPEPADYLACELTIAPSHVVLGQPVTASWTVQGGTPPYSASHFWSIGYQGEGVFDEPSATSGESSATYVPTRPCDGVIVLTITDSYGRKLTERSLGFAASETLPSPTPQPLTLSLALSAEQIKAGDSLTVTAQAQGGVLPYVYTYNWIVYEQGQPMEDLGTYKSATNTSTRTMNYGYSGSVAVAVQDAAAATLGDSASFTITGSEIVAPLTLSASLDKTTVKAGQALTASALASGGHPPYNYSFVWQVADNDVVYYAGEGSGGESAHTQTIRFGQEGAAIVSVSDAYGRKAQSEPLLFLISGSTPVTPFHASAAPGASSVQAGGEMSVSVTVSGGQPPCEYAYVWIIEEFGLEQVLAVDEGASNLSSQVIPYGRSGYVRWTVVDSAGRYISGDSPAFAITGGTVAKPLTLQASLASDRVPVGGSAKAAIQPSGGLPPYAYAWLCFLDLGEGLVPAERIDSSQEETEWPVEGGQRGAILPLLYDSVGRSAQGEPLLFQIMADPGFLPGDANQDGSVNIQDLVTLIDYLVSGTTPKSMDNADANGQGGVDIQDLVWIIDQIVGG
ncbi:MAG: dockerin type I repeat-containing protein [Christensenellales bacterium]